jgi:hypothetical protein
MSETIVTGAPVLRAPALSVGNAGDLISPQVIADADRLSAEFAMGRPFKHVVIDDFLRPEIAERMVSDFPRVLDPSTLVNEFGDPNPKSCVSDIKAVGGVYGEMDAYIQSPAFLQLMTRITGIADLRYDPWYFGAGTHENFHGAGLDAHYDFNIHPVTAQHRRLNAIVYLNESWRLEWGGSLNLHSDPWDLQNDQVLEVPLVFNRCVIFETTESSWHSVPTVNLPEEHRERSRKSFTIYLYTDTRPAEEAAPPHQTVYVQAGLAPHIRAGHTLTADDVAEIEANLARRQHYLRGLYEREYAFSETVENLKAQNRRLLIPLLGYGFVREVTEAPFVDGWMAALVCFRFHPRRPVKRVRVNGWNTESAQPTELTLEVAGQRASKVIKGGRFSLDLRLQRPLREPADLSIRAGPLRYASEEDRRLVSVLVDTIELLH